MALHHCVMHADDHTLSARAASKDGQYLQGTGGAAADDSTAGGDPLTKVVLARRTDVLFRGELDPLALLAALQVSR